MTDSKPVRLTHKMARVNFVRVDREERPDIDLKKSLQDVAAALSEGKDFKDNGCLALADGVVAQLPGPRKIRKTFILQVEFTHDEDAQVRPKFNNIVREWLDWDEIDTDYGEKPKPEFHPREDGATVELKRFISIT